MQSKTLILILFGVWCAICWRWYTCGIKEICSPTTVAATTQPFVESPAIEPEPDSTIAQLQAAQRAAAEKPVMSSSRSNPNATRLKAVNPNDYESVQMEEVEDRVVIHFPYNSIRRQDSEAIEVYLSRLATYLIASGSKVRITGHADFVSDSQNNNRLGLQRAQAIRSSLIKKGVSKSQISIKSFGESKPMGTNDTPQGRYMNRRAEIRVTD
ncbi:MAG: OmpA family protein [Saprospiraceae bacterium]